MPSFLAFSSGVSVWGSLDRGNRDLGIGLWYFGWKGGNWYVMCNIICDFGFIVSCFSFNIILSKILTNYPTHFCYYKLNPDIVILTYYHVSQISPFLFNFYFIYLFIY